MPVTPRYRKIGPEHCDYPRLVYCQQHGLWMCDALTHNSRGGCRNPRCFKYEPRQPRRRRA